MKEYKGLSRRLLEEKCTVWTIYNMLYAFYFLFSKCKLCISFIITIKYVIYNKD